MLAIRTILLNGPLDEAAAESAGAQLRALQELDALTPVRLCVSSPGGDLAAGLGLAQAVRDAACPVSTLCMGQARGVALLVTASGAPGRRYSLPHTYLSLELVPPSTSTAAPVRLDAAALPRLRELVVGELAERSGRPAEAVGEDAAAGRVLTPEEAVAYGLVDRVVTSASEIR